MLQKMLAAQKREKNRVENCIEISIDTQPNITFSKQKYDRPYDCIPSPAALVFRCRKLRSLCPKEVFFVTLCKSGGLLLSSPRSLVIPWPTPLAHSFIADGHVPAIGPKISFRIKKLHRQPS